MRRLGLINERVQPLHLTVELAIGPSLHVYAAPTPDGYAPLCLEIAPIDGLELRPAIWHDPSRFGVAGLDEEFWVHEGTIRRTLPFAFTAPPGAGDQVLRASLHYQACGKTECSPLPRCSSSCP